MRKDFNYNMSSYESTTFSREDNYNGSLIVKILFFFFQPLDVRMRKKQAQQEQPPQEDLQQEVEILKISRVKHIFRKDILVTIINSFVFSKLYYCSSVLSNTSASNIRKLDIKQQLRRVKLYKI